MNATPVDLPDHVDLEWKAWPRKLEAHVRWGLRQRQIEAYCRNGRIKVYRCPDDSLRIDPEVLTEMFGPPDQVQGADRDLSAAARRRKLSELAGDYANDPHVLMFRAATSMITDLHAQQIAQLKGISDPLSALLAGYQAALAARDARIAVLESQVVEESAMRLELEELRRETELRRAREAAAEARRDATLQLLKDQIPSLASAWLAGDTLSGFAKRAPREAIESLIESGAFSEQDNDLLRRGAGIPRPAPQPQPSQSNGMHHGNS